MRVYYNDNERYCVEWLKELIKAGHLPPGDVDDRDIRLVQPGDLQGYDQAHFFAGIGGWPLALQWTDWGDRPVWTGSCPCQPFSAAGKRAGFEDPRHLWPEWYRLIRECCPPTILGEQVARATVWIDSVFTDLEAIDYACGATVIPACAVGAPHIRERFWFMADSNAQRWQRRSNHQGKRSPERDGLTTPSSRFLAGRNRVHERNEQGHLEANFGRSGQDGSRRPTSRDHSGRIPGEGTESRAQDVADSDRERCGLQWQPEHTDLESAQWDQSDRRSSGGWWDREIMADTSSPRCETGVCASSGSIRDTAWSPQSERRGDVLADPARLLSDRTECESGRRTESTDCGPDVANPGLEGLPVSERQELFGEGWRQEGRAASERDWWRVEPPVGRVAYGVPHRVAKLRAIGNSIVPQLAAQFIRAVLSV